MWGERFVRFRVLFLCRSESWLRLVVSMICANRYSAPLSCLIKALGGTVREGIENWWERQVSMVFSSHSPFCQKSGEGGSCCQWFLCENKIERRPHHVYKKAEVKQKWKWLRMVSENEQHFCACFAFWQFHIGSPQSAHNSCFPFELWLITIQSRKLWSSWMECSQRE